MPAPGTIAQSMNEDTARVPALLLCGGTMDDRDSAIARLAKPLADGHPVAVLRTGAGMFGGSDLKLGSHVVVKRAPMGCLCCTAGMVFRVAVISLLHATRPGKLIVDLGSGAHVATLEAELRGASLGRSVRLVERMDLDEAA